MFFDIWKVSVAYSSNLNKALGREGVQDVSRLIHDDVDKLRRVRMDPRNRTRDEGQGRDRHHGVRRDVELATLVLFHNKALS